MNSSDIGKYIDQLFFLFMAAWATGVAYGFLPPSVQDGSAKEMRLKLRKLFKVLGPIGLVLAILQIVLHILGVRGWT